MEVLVLGAGGPAGVNTCRALKAAGHEVYAADQDARHLVWSEQYATTIPWPSLAHIFADVVMAQPDTLVDWLSLHREQTFATFLPSPQTIALCQDKWETALEWRRAGVRDDVVSLIDSDSSLTDAIAYQGFPFWLRARRGAGAKAAIVANSYYEALHWYGFWHRRDPELDFIAEEYLPGRDYSWCGIFYEGEVVAMFARQRLEYIYPGLTPEGLTGTPTIATVVVDPEVDRVAHAAVKALDPEPHGVYCVDLRENAVGEPMPTEINAGRFSTTVGLWSLHPNANFVALAAELAVGDRSRLESWMDLPAGLTLLRHIDCGHLLTRSEAFHSEVTA